MMSATNKRQSIGWKLTELLESVSSEVQSLQERRVTSHMKRAFQALSEPSGTVCNEAKVILYWQDCKVMAFFKDCHKARRQLTFTEMLELFTGVRFPILAGGKDTINKKLISLWQSLSMKHQIQPQNQFIQVTNRKGQVRVQLYHGETPLEEISVRDLIMNFKSKENP